MKLQTILIKNAQIICANSSHEGNTRDILIEDGIITQIGQSLTAEGAIVVKEEGLHVSMGWLDLGVFVGDPGYEHREDLESVSAAAVAGGYTAIATYPNTNPTVHDKSQVQYITRNSRHLPIDILPIGAVSKDAKGEDITEMYDMQTAGAVAFSDGNHPIEDSGMMLRALQYVKPFDGVIINRPQEQNSSHNGQMNEGAVSTSLGMKGIPHVAEELMVIRDIYLAEYTDSHVHIANISTARTVQLIRDAKERGLKVTASVAALNLAFTDEVLMDFDTHFKVLPPLRLDEDIAALQAGLKDGTIDCISSNHTPWETECKDLEFPYAEFGAIGLESCFGLLNHYLDGILSLGEIIDKIAYEPRVILDLPIPALEEGEAAQLTLFIPDEEYVFTEKMIRSKSKNSPLIGEELTGKVIGVINKGGFYTS